MQELIALVLFAVSMTGTPGPNNIMLLSSGLTFGVKPSLPHYFGVSIGMFILISVIGLGLAKLFEVFPVLMQLIEIFGVVYLLYLAYKIATSSAVDQTSPNLKAHPFTVLQAIAFQWVNPKVWIASSTAVSTYILVDNSSITNTFLVATCFLFVGLVCTSFWLLGGQYLSKWIRDVVWVVKFNRIMAFLLVLSIMPAVKSWL